MRWIRARIRGRSIPVLPVVGYRDALILIPSRMVRALRRGLGRRDLYGRRPAAILALDFVEVRRLVRRSDGGESEPLR